MPPMTPSSAPFARRRKTTEACTQCRARKLKCDGFSPCKTCEKAKMECSYDPSAATSRLSGNLDAINARVMELERAVFGEKTYQLNQANRQQTSPTAECEAPGTIIYDEPIGSYEVYGDEQEIYLSRGLAFKKASEQEIYTSGKTQYYDQGNWPVQESVCRAHFDIFLSTVYNILPLWKISSLRGKFDKACTESQMDAQTPQSALVHSILALGALYSNLFENDASLADRHFTEAQNTLWRILSLNCLENIQSAMLTATYAYFTAQPAGKADSNPQKPPTKRK
ncbi:hypothetical protein N7540_004738 [Penicillium herquei]|nr:hypothetical protein N7540_004738 [Penicillium herquei]